MLDHVTSMLALCIPVTSWSAYESYARPGIDRVLALAPDTLVLARESHASYQETVNGMLDELQEVEGLEAAVIIHQDVELLDSAISSVLPLLFQNRRIAIVGVVGSTHRSGIRWWAGEGRGGRVELPDGHAPIAFGGGFAVVPAVDGTLLAFSPWAVRALRFDMRFCESFHGYDVDICLQAQAHGRFVVVDNLSIRHHKLDGLRDGRDETWIEADVKIRRKWDVPRAPAGLSWARGPMLA
jgi:hypothetical protein